MLGKDSGLIVVGVSDTQQAEPHAVLVDNHHGHPAQLGRNIRPEPKAWPRRMAHRVIVFQGCGPYTNQAHTKLSCGSLQCGLDYQLAVIKRG